MRLIPCKKLHRALIKCFILLLIGNCGLAYAKITDKTSSNAIVNMVISNNKGSELQLEVRQMPLAEALDTIARKANVIIHYSVLPEGLITATCVGSELKQILECLLDKKADIIVRNSNASSKINNKAEGAEAWILGTRLSSSPTAGNCVATSTDTNSPSLLRINEENSHQISTLENDKIDEILKRAESKNPNQQIEAIRDLLTIGRKGDPSIKTALDKALIDQNENVRAQAISTLSHLEGSSSHGAIQEAINDASANVRMKAVDGTNDIPTLQQAINDSNESIRSLASAKLELLTESTYNKQ